jgi:hypothetical protein
LWANGKLFGRAWLSGRVLCRQNLREKIRNFQKFLPSADNLRRWLKKTNLNFRLFLPVLTQIQGKPTVDVFSAVLRSYVSSAEPVHTKKEGNVLASLFNRHKTYATGEVPWMISRCIKVSECVVARSDHLVKPGQIISRFPII